MTTTTTSGVTHREGHPRAISDAGGRASHTPPRVAVTDTTEGGALGRTTAPSSVASPLTQEHP